MSERYEWESAAIVDIACLPPGEELGDGHTVAWALVIGNPHATAFAAEGSRDELLAFTHRLVAAIGSTFVAEHENGLHFSEHEARCPSCVEEDGEEYDRSRAKEDARNKYRLSLTENQAEERGR